MDVKVVGGGIAVLLILGGCFLWEELDEARERAARVEERLEGALSILGRMESSTKTMQTLMLEWREGQENIHGEFRRQAAVLEEVLNRDQTTRDFGDMRVPDSVLELYARSRHPDSGSSPDCLHAGKGGTDTPGQQSQGSAALP